jgi:hypothetical protein
MKQNGNGASQFARRAEGKYINTLESDMASTMQKEGRKRNKCNWFYETT